MKLANSFFIRSDVTRIARQLLGKVLVTRIDGQLAHGIIVETEAYSYKEKGSHAFKGMTKRNEVMLEGRMYTFAMVFMKCSTWSLIKKGKPMLF